MLKKVNAQQKIVLGIAILVIISQIVLYFRYRAFDTQFPFLSAIGYILLFGGLAIPVEEPKVPANFRIRMMLIAFALAIFSFNLGLSF